jgi:hypothetical protein
LYLFDVVKVCLHAFNGNILVGLGALGLEHLGEGAFPFFADETIF